MRGVHPSGSGTGRGTLGSSPHARGPYFSRAMRKCFNRIIPACAGSIAPYRTGRQRVQDHPRMRGVHDASTADTFNVTGSSPHARGPLMDLHNKFNGIGIIPACAGSILKKARKNAILEGITIPFHLTSQTQPLSTGNLPMPDVPVSPIPNDWQQWTICNWA